MDYILQTTNLEKVYGKQKAAENINLSIKKGDIYGLIGKNGAGKTTILRMLTNPVSYTHLTLPTKRIV